MRFFDESVDSFYQLQEFLFAGWFDDNGGRNIELCGERVVESYFPPNSWWRKKYMAFRLSGIRQARQRLISVAVVAALILSNLPIQISVGHRKDTSKPFPCQHRACGCMSAEQCAKSCCCFPKQDVPRNEKDKVVGSRVTKVSRRLAPPACCRLRQPVADQRAKSPAKQVGHRPASQVAQVAQSRGKPVRVELVLTDQARRCRGLTVLAGQFLDFYQAPLPTPFWLEIQVAARVPVAAEQFEQRDLPPPVPPPRLRDVG
jgi:hypothetical protein